MLSPAGGLRGLQCLSVLESFLPQPTKVRDGVTDIHGSSFGIARRRSASTHTSQLTWQFKFALAAAASWDLVAAVALVAAAATPAAAPSSLSPLLAAAVSLYTLLLILLSTSTRRGIAWRRLHNASLHRLLAPALLPMCLEQHSRRWSSVDDRSRGPSQRPPSRRPTPRAGAVADTFSAAPQSIGLRDPGPIDHTGKEPSVIAAHWHSSGFSVARQHTRCASLPLPQRTCALRLWS